MTQFPPTPEHQTTYAGNQHGDYAMPAKTSGLAIGGFVCSVIFCCPVTTILGPILGLIALMSMKGRDEIKGKGLAIAAIIIGVILTAVWVVVGIIGFKFAKDFENFVRTGPSDALTAGSGGDIQAFQDAFVLTGPAPSRGEASAFISRLEAEYGAFQSADIDETNPDAFTPSPGEPQIIVPYILTFADATVDAEVLVNVVDPTTGKLFNLSLAEIRVMDSNGNPIVYPPDSGSSSNSAQPGPADPVTPGPSGEGGG